MSENTTVHVGQIRVSDTGRNQPKLYYKITKLSYKMLWYVPCDPDGSTYPSGKTYRARKENADLYLGKPLETKQTE